MTERVGDVVLIEPEPDRLCQYCGEFKECRPYGPNGTDICFKCAMATPERKAEAVAAFRRVLGDGPVEIVDLRRKPSRTEGAP